MKMDDLYDFSVIFQIFWNKYIQENLDYFEQSGASDFLYYIISNFESQGLGKTKTKQL